MRFRLKVTFCMISLMTLLFSFGSCALISCSFQASLDREQANAQLYAQVQAALQARAQARARARIGGRA